MWSADIVISRWKWPVCGRSHQPEVSVMVESAALIALMIQMLGL